MKDNEYKQFYLEYVTRESKEHYEAFEINNQGIHGGQIVVYGNRELADTIVNLLNNYVEIMPNDFKGTL
jgi:hypothetical protein